MAGRIAALHKQAQRKFLGHGPVVGIGIGGKSEDELVFTLEEESADTEREIRQWALDREVIIRIQVSGSITLLSC